MSTGAKTEGEGGRRLENLRGVGREDNFENILVRLNDLDMSERKNRYTKSRMQVVVGAQEYPCGTANRESRTRMVRECQLYKEERDRVGSILR